MSGLFDRDGAGTVWLRASLDEKARHALACAVAGLLAFRDWDEWTRGEP